MGKKVWGVLCNDEENVQFICTPQGKSIEVDIDEYAPSPVTKEKAIACAESLSKIFPRNIYTIFKMKFKETI